MKRWVSLPSSTAVRPSLSTQKSRAKWQRLSARPLAIAAIQTPQIRPRDQRHAQSTIRLARPERHRLDSSFFMVMHTSASTGLRSHFFGASLPLPCRAARGTAEAVRCRCTLRARKSRASTPTLAPWSLQRTWPSPTPSSWRCSSSTPFRMRPDLSLCRCLVKRSLRRSRMRPDPHPTARRQRGLPCPHFASNGYAQPVGVSARMPQARMRRTERSGCSRSRRSCRTRAKASRRASRGRSLSFRHTSTWNSDSGLN
mmetsp:Transcript_28710/g.87989  ORF Transcript_28710/g.87989 Transcript_28710/m.87989 type:complete len:256 (-) Transcript_28710:57-824(-)